MNANELMESKDLREQLAGRIEVLEKVKKLLLLPKLAMMTGMEVAKYYEVDYDAVRQCYKRNKEEFDSDGAVKMSPAVLKVWMGQNVTTKLDDVTTKTGRGFCEFALSDDVVLHVPNAGITFFPTRAVLRFGMLLRDSKIAQEVRTQLLNVWEHSDDGTVDVKGGEWQTE